MARPTQRGGGILCRCVWLDYMTECGSHVALTILVTQNMKSDQYAGSFTEAISMRFEDYLNTVKAFSEPTIGHIAEHPREI